MTAFTPRLPDYAHQTRGKDKMRGKTAFALFMEMGTGKSKTSLDDLCEAALAGTVDRCLIVAGKGSYGDWIAEHIPKHWREDLIQTDCLQWIRGKPKEFPAIEYFLKKKSGFKFLVIHVEALSVSEKAEKLASFFVQSGKCAIIVDEASKIKTRTSERTKTLIRLGRKARMRRILTGSPVTQSPLDLWSQCEFLEPGLLGFRNFLSFRAHFCEIQPMYLGKRKIDQVVGYKNLSELERLVEPFSFRVMKEDCLDLPPKIYQRFLVELTDDQERAYSEMKRFSMTELTGGGFASATLAISRLSKLHQIVCGHIVDEDGQTRDIKSNRVAGLMEVVQEAGGKTLVWCAFRRDVEMVARELRKEWGSKSVVEYHGGTSVEDCALAIRGIQDGDARFFVGTQAKGGYGITLTAAPNTVYFSNNFNLEHRLQSEDRNHRIGQTGSVTYTDLCSPGTIDEKLISALREKKDIAHLVMGDGIRDWIR